jgi:ubiquitin-like protein ATG12
MTTIPDDGETMSTTGMTSGEGEVTEMSSDPSPVNNNIPEDDAPVAPGRTTIQQHHDQHSSTLKVSEKESVGSAPILKKSKFLMNADDRFAVAIAFLRKVLKLSTASSSTSSSVSNTLGTKSSSLFLYVNAAFVPSPDERIGDLFDCFGSRGELVVHYSLQEAWG